MELGTPHPMAGGMTERPQVTDLSGALTIPGLKPQAPAGLQEQFRDSMTAGCPEERSICGKFEAKSGKVFKIAKQSLNHKIQDSQTVQDGQVIQGSLQAHSPITEGLGECLGLIGAYSKRKSQMP